MSGEQTRKETERRKINPAFRIDPAVVSKTLQRPTRPNIWQTDKFPVFMARRCQREFTIVLDEPNIGRIPVPKEVLA